MAATIRPAYILALPELFDSDPSNSSGIKVGSSALAVIPWVHGITHSPVPATAITLTQGGFVVEGHPDGIRVEDVNLWGWLEQPAPKSLVRDAEGLESETYARWRSVYDLLQQALQSSRRTVYLYAVDEGIALECAAATIRLTKGAPDKIRTRYDLSLRGLKRIETLTLLDAWPSEMKPIGPEKHWYDSLTSAYSDASAGLTAVKAGFYSVINTAQSYVDKVNAVVAVAEGLVRDLDNMVSALSDLLHQPLFLVQRLKHLRANAEQCAQLANQTVFAFVTERGLGFVTPDTAGSSFAVNDSSARNARAVAAVYKTLTDRLALLQLRAQASAASSLPVERYWTVGSFDTLESIATADYGAPSRAADIASGNRLVYPFISPTGGPGIARPGDKLRVPGATKGTLQTAPTGEEPSVEAAIYGTDIRLDDTGDLYRVGADNDVDFALISGVPNVTAAIRRRAVTVLGTNREWPALGLPAAIGEADTDENYAAFITGLTRGLLQDDRVLTVRQLRADRTPNGWAWEGNVNLVTGVQLAETGAAQ